MTKNDSALVLASGGLDSAVLLAWAARRHRQVYPLYIRFGLRWENAEIFSLKAYLRHWRSPSVAPLTILDHPVQDLHPHHWSLTGRRVPGRLSADAAVYVPGRNLLLLSKAGTFAALHKIRHLYLGILAANPFSDSRPHFIKSMTRALRLALGEPLRIHTPFRRWTKEKVVQYGKDLPLEKTFSCLNPKGIRACGRCNKCAEWDRAKREFRKLV